MAAHQAPPSLGFSRQEHWSGLPFPFPMHESEKWKWSCSVVSNSLRPHGLQPTRLLRPWHFPGKSTGEGCHRLLWIPLLPLHIITSPKIMIPFKAVHLNPSMLYCLHLEITLFNLRRWNSAAGITSLLTPLFTFLLGSYSKCEGFFHFFIVVKYM